MLMSQKLSPSRYKQTKKTKSNGLVERTNRKILEILRHLAGKFHESWKDWLSHVPASINDSINTCTGKTPHYIMYGFDKRLQYDVLVHFHVPLHFLDDYSKLQLHCFQTIHESVREKLKASREEILHKQHAQAAPVTIHVGDSVMKRAPDRSCKLSPKFSGPFLVTSRYHPNKFKILDPSNNVTEVVHVDRLKKVSPSFTSDTIPFSPPTNLLPSDTRPSSHGYWLRLAECPRSVPSPTPPLTCKE